jgi:hypothetical protein
MCKLFSTENFPIKFAFPSSDTELPTLVKERMESDDPIMTELKIEQEEPNLAKLLTERLEEQVALPSTLASNKDPTLLQPITER